MKLMGGRYAPITDAIGFLEANFSRVIAADERWRASLGGYVSRSINGPLPNLLDAILPLTGPMLRRIWVATTGPWTAYFDNFVLGSDTFPPVSYLAQELGCRGVTIGCRDETPKRGASVSFAIYGPEQTTWLNLIRSVAAVQDMGLWEWTASGTIQSFEDVAAYERRAVRKRLTSQMLSDYCSALGIQTFNESHYSRTGHLVEDVGIKANVRTETLQEARVWHGLD